MDLYIKNMKGYSNEYFFFTVFINMVVFHCKNTKEATCT